MAHADPAVLLAHASFVRALARGVLGQDDLVEDAVQDTWLVALSHAPRDASRLRSWLGSIGRRRALDRRRRETARALRERAAAVPEAQPSSADLVERADVGRRMAQALLALPEPLRDALLWRYYDDLPPRVIAARLALPVESVRTRLKRGLTALRERLGSDERCRERWLPALLAWTGQAAAAAPPAAGLASATGRWLPRLVAVLGLAAGATWFAWPQPERGGESLQAPASEALRATGGEDGARGGVERGAAPALRGTAREGGPLPPNPAAPGLPGEPTTDPAAPAQGPAAVVEGDVDVVVAVSGRDDQPLAGAAVLLQRDGHADDAHTADATGRVRLRLPARATFLLAVSAPGHARQNRGPHEAQAFAGEPLEVKLQRGTHLDGRVLDAATNEPLAGALVRVRSGGTLGDTIADDGAGLVGEARSDAEGRFHVEGLPLEWVVTAWAELEGYARHPTTTIAAGDGPALALTLKLERAGTIDVLVLGADGAPAPGARVLGLVPGLEGLVAAPSPLYGSGSPASWELPSVEVLTDSGGRAALHGVPFSVPWRVRATAATRGASEERTGTLLTAEAPRAQVVLTLRRAAAFHVRPLDAHGALLAVAGRWVGERQVVPTESELATPAPLVFDGLEPGPVLIVLAPQGYLPRRLVATLAEGETRREDVRFERGASVSGRVVDGEGTPVAGRLVYGSPAGGHSRFEQCSTTDAQGRFHLSGLPEGPVSLSASDETATSADVVVTAPARDVAVVLVRRAKVSLRIRLPPGGAVPEYAFRIITGEDDGETGHGSDFEEGPIVWFADPGTQRLAYRATGYRPFERTLELAAGATLDLGEHVLDPGFTLRGRVVDSQGRPVVAARIACAASSDVAADLPVAETPLDEAVESVLSGQDGAFTLRTLPGGPAWIVISSEGFEAVRERHDASATTAPCTVRLKRSSR